MCGGTRPLISVARLAKYQVELNAVENPLSELDCLICAGRKRFPYKHNTLWPSDGTRGRKSSAKVRSYVPW